MDNDKKLFEELLKADGIAPDNISDAERAVFRKILDSEQKHMKRLSWKYVGAMSIFVIAMLGLCVSENILEALHIPFVVACLVLMAAMLIARIRYEPGYTRKMMESGRKISKLYYLIHGKHRGLILVGKKDGKRHVYWLRIIMIAAGLWVIMSLGGAGVFYLLCQRWIYASGPNLHIFYCTAFSLSFVTFALYAGLKTPQDELPEVKTKQKQSKPTHRPNIWRIIMQSKITRFAAAAVIIIAIITSAVTILDQSASPAYAMEQTIQASHGVQYLHIKSFIASVSDTPIECWAEFDPSGQVKNVRVNKPAWMSPGDGESVIVWKDNKMQVWAKKKNFLVTLKDKEVAAKILSMVEQLDPKNAAANILQAQEKGDSEVEIQEPENKAEPIVITATSLVENDQPFQRAILFVDQATKLLNSVETYQLKDGEYIYFSTTEFYDYNIPIDSNMFTLDNIPDDVMRMDQTTQQVGLSQDDLSDNEIAVKVIRQFLQALIEKDYAKAGRLWGGVPAERMKKAYGQIRFIRIISIGEPTPKPEMRALYVPCTVEIKENGKVTQWHPEHSYVRQVHGQPERWEIIGGFRGI